LQELVVAVQFVMLFTYRLDSVEDGNERVLQGFGMPTKSS
jgi:hypothetical protein